MARLLFLDMARVIAIVFIVVHHLKDHAMEIDIRWLFFYYHLGPTFSVDLGGIGVWLFIFVSGASLALGSNSFDSLKDIGSFYKKRLLRIYPIYWVGVLLSLMIIPLSLGGAWRLTLTDYARNFAGFQMFFITNNAWEYINGPYWFIGLIVSLYILFPIVYLTIEKHPHISLLSFFLIYISSRMIMWYDFPQFTGGGWEWFPLCRIFEFALGIYVIRQGFYLKHESTKILGFLGGFSFYVFLAHGMFLHIIDYFHYGLTIYVSVTVVFACLLYSFDGVIQNLIRRNARVPWLIR